MATAPEPSLTLVSDRQRLAGGDLPALAAAAAAAGVDWIQIREKDLSAKQLASLTREAIRAVQWLRLQSVRTSNAGPKEQSAANVRAHTRIIVNDRLDVAIAERADGVHLGENSLPPSEAKRLIHSAQQKGLIAEDFLVGVSCHSLQAAKSAELAGADRTRGSSGFPWGSRRSGLEANSKAGL